MDLGPEWERKALIVVGIIFAVVVIYAYNPFAGNPDANAQNQSINTDIPVTTPASPVVTSNNSTNTTNATMGNGTFQISADVAKNIAMGGNPGFTAGTPSQGNVTINNTVVQVWIVPMTQGSLSKSVYVDLSSGTIVGSA